MAVPFDEHSLTRSGEEVTIVDDVSTSPKDGRARYRLSKSGTLVYRPRPSTDGRLLMWVDRAGRETPVGIPPRSFDNPSVSPDGQQLAFTSGPGDRRDIWTYPLDGGPLSRLTDDGNNSSPLWTLDGKGIIYARRDGGNESKIVLHRFDGTPLETLAADLHDLSPQAMTADGKRLVVSVQPPTDDFYLAQASRGSSKLQTLFQTPGLPNQARLSPDGRWLAYCEDMFNAGNNSYRNEIIVQSYPDTGVRHQVTVDGGNHPLWSRDGKELFYQFGGRIFAVPIDATRGLTWGQPQVLFTRQTPVSFQYSYDVAPDGRFLMVSQAPDEAENNRLQVVVNWRNELLSRMSVPR
jgi:Tol biopolymer transport system component